MNTFLFKSLHYFRISNLSLLGALVVVFQVGCSTLHPKSDSPASTSGVVQSLSDDSIQDNSQSMDSQKLATPEDSTPVNMAIFWKEDAVKTAGRPTVKGFTGRIYFYNRTGELVPVEGDLTVYGYDDTEEDSGEIPHREYRLPASQFAKQYSPSEIGHSYTIWIPWENFGGLRKSITLIPMFKTIDQTIVQGGINRLTLTGKAPETTEKTVVQNSETNIDRYVREYRRNQQQQSTSDEPTSFPIPKSLSRRMSMNNSGWQGDPAVNQRLSDLESPQMNADGARFNRISISNGMTQQNSMAAPQVTNAATNFSDSSPLPRSNHFPVTHQMGTFEMGQSQKLSGPPSIQPVRPASRAPFGVPGSLR